MGLDMFARTIDFEPDKSIDIEIPDEESTELHYWRKHPNLHGWMEKLYRDKGGTDEFNCRNVLITAEDLNRLESTVLADMLPMTDGFFFGKSGQENKEDDIEFIAKARQAMLDGKFVFYTSWW